MQYILILTICTLLRLPYSLPSNTAFMFSENFSDASSYVRLSISAGCVHCKMSIILVTHIHLEDWTFVVCVPYLSIFTNDGNFLLVFTSFSKHTKIKHASCPVVKFNNNICIINDIRYLLDNTIAQVELERA